MAVTFSSDMGTAGNCRKFENKLITTLNGKNEVANKMEGNNLTYTKQNMHQA
jgi:hypothetical protein